MPTIKEMRDVCQQRRPDANGKMVWAGNWFNRIAVRWFSIYITWLCVKLNISANTVSLIMTFSGLAGFVLCIPHLLWLNILGGLLLLLAPVLDCVDGEVARWTKKTSLKGLYLDLVYHVLCNAPAIIICALHLYAMYRDEKYLILGFLTYAMAQIRLGLEHEFARLSPEIPKTDTSTQAITHPRKVSLTVNIRRRIIGAVKWLLHKCVDQYIVRFVAIAAVFLAHAGIDGLLIFMAWWFLVVSIITNAGHLLNKYFVLIPEKGHTKTVE